MPSELVSLAEKKFSAKEIDLLNELTKGDSTIEVIVPEKIEPKDWMLVASVTCRALVRSQLQEQAMTTVLGRLLIIARDNPAIYKDNGYEGFENFIAGEIRNKWGVSRSTCYEAMRSAEFSAAAKLTTEEVKQIPRVNMRELVKLVPKGEESKSNSRKLIEKAMGPVADFREHIETKLHVERGETVGAFVRFGCSKAFLKRFSNFMEDPDIQAYCGSGKIDRILDKMMEECSEWKAKAHDEERAAKSGD